MLKLLLGRASFYVFILVTATVISLLRLNYDNAYLLRNGVTVLGTVESKHTEEQRRAKKRSTEYFISYRFPAGSVDYVGTQTTSQMMYDSLSAGKTVPVIYVPNDPRHNRLNFGDVRVRDTQWMWMAYVGVFLLWLLFYRKAMCTYWRLLRHGKRAEATLSEIEKKSGISKVNSSAFLYVYTVDGKRFTGREEIDIYQKCFRMSYEAGSKIDILYDPQHPQASMMAR